MKKDKYIYKSKEVTQKEVVQWSTPSWLRRIGMDMLVHGMAMLSREYGLKWAASWDDHWDDPKWLNRAMLNTFGRLREEDRELVRELYEDWCWYAANLDLESLVDLGYAAEVYLLDRNGRRISAEGRYQTILVKLDGASREDAKGSLTSEYDFVRWWY